MCSVRPSFRTLLPLAVLACAVVASAARAQDAGQPASDPGASGALGAGLGVAALSLETPSLEGPRRLTTGAHAALEVTLRGAASLGSQLELGLDARYATSLGLQVQETPLGGVARETALRVHSLSGGLVPALRFAAREDAVALGLYLGWSLQAVSAAVAPSIPAHTFHGPAAGLELAVPIARGAVVLTLRPTIIGWLWVTDRLRDQGRLTGSALAFALDAALDVAVTQTFGLALAYRGSSGSMRSELGTLATSAHAGTARAVVKF